jgi:hypothetical protein
MKLTEPAATIIVGVLGVLIAAGTYFSTERAKLQADSYVRRADRYERLLETATAFHVSPTGGGTRGQFLSEFDQCWLYCPDTVIRAGYRFLDSVKTGANSNPQSRLTLFQEFVVAIREDLIEGSRPRRTSMRANEYQVLRANSAPAQ